MYCPHVYMLQRSKSDACEEQIQDEVQRQVKRCVCPKQYHMHKLTDGQYRVCRLDYVLFSFVCATTTGVVGNGTRTNAMSEESTQYALPV